MIERIFGYPRDGKGQLVLRPVAEESTEEVPEPFQAIWSARGATEEQTKQLWEATQRHEWTRNERALRAGIIDPLGTVFDSERWAEVVQAADLEWEEIAKGILGHGSEQQQL